MNMGAVDWSGVFSSSVPVAEIVLRGSLVYLILFGLLRVALKREAGTLGIPDLLMVVLIADASQNAMAANYHSVTDGLVLVATIVFWNYALDWLAFRYPRFRHLVEPAPLLLVKDGRFLRRNMRKELITEEELLGLLREEGIDSIEQVKEARMESDGRVSAVRSDAASSKSRTQHRGV
jgi:uncharacterized membrane protein YcaP (DUF421 family)